MDFAPLPATAAWRHQGVVESDRAAVCRDSSQARHAAILGFLLRDAGDLADEHLAVEVEERF
jgi:hypothetical protein